MNIGTESGSKCMDFEEVLHLEARQRQLYNIQSGNEISKINV